MTMDNGTVTVTSKLPILGLVSGTMTLKDLAKGQPIPDGN
jgi:hypothetical protein